MNIEPDGIDNATGRNIKAQLITQETVAIAPLAGLETWVSG
jgi:hypothetical protein